MNGVLLIYTGGTIGSLPKHEGDPLSPLVPGTIDRITRMLPGYDERGKRILLAGRWVPLSTLSWDQPLDSSNITLADWVRIARAIRDRYGEHEGFVVLHGTDTMAFTASALAFMLRNLSKPVILTGSQRPIGESRSDAVQNLVTAIELAAASSLGATVVPEVCVFFRDELHRGCRTRKLDATGYRAFASPKYPALGTAGERISIERKLLAPATGKPLRLLDALEPNIASLDVFPGMSASLLANMLGTEGLRGVVLKTFGAGNAPTTPEFLDAIGAAVARGILIVDVSQCASGEVDLGRYEVSSELLARGVLSGLDMTPEAALTKLSVVLGTEPRSELASDLMQLSLSGEQSRSIYNIHFGGGEASPEHPEASLEPLYPMMTGPRPYERSGLEEAILRVIGLRGRGSVELSASLDGELLGSTRRELGPAPEHVFLDVTAAAKRLVDPSGAHLLTLACAGEGPVAWLRADLALFVAS